MYYLCIRCLCYRQKRERCQGGYFIDNYKEQKNVCRAQFALHPSTLVLDILLVMLYGFHLFSEHAMVK